MHFASPALVGLMIAASVGQSLPPEHPGLGEDAPLVYGCDFESATRGVPEGWYPTYTDRRPETSEFVVFGWCENEAYSGAHSISIELDKHFPRTEMIAYNWLVRPQLEPDAKYRISFWWKAREKGTQGFVYAECDDRDNWNEEKPMSYVPPSAFAKNLKYDGSGWKQFVFELETPQGLRCTRVRLGLSTPHNSGHKIFFDDLRITRLAKEPDRRRRRRS